MISDQPSHSPHARPSFDDTAARRAHTASLDRLSSRVQAQLAQRRRTALSPDARPTASRGWPMLALGSTATLAVAIGLFALHGNDSIDVWPASDTVAASPASNISATAGMANTASAQISDVDTAIPSAVTPPAAPTVANNSTPLPAPTILTAESTGTDDVIGLASLEESPDFYLWLGSEDAQANVTEFL